MIKIPPNNYTTNGPRRENKMSGMPSVTRLSASKSNGADFITYMNSLRRKVKGRQANITMLDTCSFSITGNQNSCQPVLGENKLMFPLPPCINIPRDTRICGRRSLLGVQSKKKTLALLGCEREGWDERIKGERGGGGRGERSKRG